MLSSRLRSLALPLGAGSGAAAAAVAAAAAAAAAALSAGGLLGSLALSRTERPSGGEGEGGGGSGFGFGSGSSPRPGRGRTKGRVEVDLMDRIASKPYIRYHNAPPSRVWGGGGPPGGGGPGLITRSTKAVGRTARRLRGGGRTGDASADPRDARRTASDYEEYRAAGEWDGELGGSGTSGGAAGERPRGIPKRVRVLTIDVPEFREAVEGECRVNLSRIFPEDVALRKRVKRKGAGKENGDRKDGAGDGLDQQQLEVVQKSLATALVRCRNRESKRIGLEIVEASVYSLNPNNMRRTYQFGRLRYDPGKYAKMKAKQGQQGKAPDTVASTAAEAFEEDEEDSTSAEADAPGDSADPDAASKKDDAIATTEDDELDAPWNQYAWIEEMRLRILGLVPFGAPVQRSSSWSRIVYGDVYRKTTPPARGFFRRMFPSFLTGDKWGDDGIDGDYSGRTPNRASSKPHAVIADGAAMQRVPGSLRHLSKCCQEADVPLFIVNDPRVWGGNTHSDLESAAEDMRSAIKARVVVNALNIKEGSMFERGRVLGKMETEARWQAKDVGRRTRKAVRDAQSRLRKEREDDWSGLGAEELRDRLADRKVIISGSTGDASNEVSAQGKETYSDGLVELCRKCMAAAEEKAGEEASQEGEVTTKSESN